MLQIGNTGVPKSMFYFQLNPVREFIPMQYDVENVHTLLCTPECLCTYLYPQYVFSLLTLMRFHYYRLRALGQYKCNNVID